MRYFNTEGICSPKEHYMVPLADRLEKIRKLYVDRKKYFVINRGRQYGKTTMLRALADYLRDEYLVIFMDFQAFGDENFADGQTFTVSFIEYLEEIFSRREELKDAVSEEAYQSLLAVKSQERIGLDKLFRSLSKMCDTANKPIVLMIDEVDSASNHQVFLDFLAMLRGYYLNREYSPTFHSVILAGMYDIKNLGSKFRSEEEHQYNSPWNIAARFNIKMSFSAGQIAQMLQEYEEDKKTGMDVAEAAGCIYEYTSGYPYLVSVICKFLDEEIPDRQGYDEPGRAWTKPGIEEAVKMLLNENVPLFDSMVKQLESYPELKDMIEQILYQGSEISFNPGAKSVSLGLMFGFLKEKNGYVAVTNHIFEMYLLGLFITEEAIRSEAFMRGQSDKSQFIKNSRLDMERVNSFYYI